MQIYTGHNATPYNIKKNSKFNFEKNSFINYGTFL